MNIVLFEPEIPLNTGNIGRTCVATNTKLHIIKPMGFEISDKALKRAGLDYWKNLDVEYYENFTQFLNKNKNINLFMATTKAKKTYCDVKYSKNDFIMFGKETAGIPEEILLNYKEYAIRIPMLENCRSLNLANSVAIVLFEALRQNNFENLSVQGDLHRYNW